MSEPARLPPADLDGLHSLWADHLEPAFQAYAEAAGEGVPELVPLAAAFVEAAVTLQELGSGEVASAPLLLGDLCLARASRLLAEVGDEGLQVAFASVVERVSAAAAAGEPFPPVRALLSPVVGGC